MTDKSWTPVGSCAHYGLPWHARYLIELGADINAVDGDGDPPTFEAVASNSTTFLEFLLEIRARYDQIDNLGHTVLHAMATFGGLGTLEVLARRQLRGLNPDVKDRQGRTAIECLHQRAAVPPGFAEAFKTFINNIRTANATEEASSDPTYQSDSDYEVFHDALEAQEQSEES